jgi:hypothetical protein
VFANLVNLVNFDLEQCLKIHGGLVHVKGTTHSSIQLLPQVPNILEYRDCF